MWSRRAWERGVRSVARLCIEYRGIYLTTEGIHKKWLDLRKVTLFIRENIWLANSKSDNKLEKVLNLKQEASQNKYDKSGIYQLTCPDCKLYYTGQTGWKFRVRFQEHLRDFKNKNKSKFAQQLVDNKHPIGPMEDIMEVVHVTNKGKLMDTTNCFHIYK